MRLLVVLLLLSFPTVGKGGDENDDARSDATATDGLATRGSEPAPGLSIRDAILLGVVEGATEYLPVSSTGHLLLFQRALGIGGEAESAGSPSSGADEAADSLAICIQSGAILAVLILYRRRFQQMLAGIFRGDAAGRRLVENLLIAFFPAAVIGLLARDWIKANLFGIGPVAAALFVGGVLILVTAKPLAKGRGGQTKGVDELSRWDCLIIGLAQCCAFWPGFSRSLATILGGLWAGVQLSAAVEFSFLLGLVTLSAATAYESLDKGALILEHYGVVSPLIAFVAAFVSAVVSIKFLISLLSRYGLTPFAYYRIALAALCAYFLIR